ncbi:stage II sporulation protein M [Chloroflexota bacterium]
MNYKSWIFVAILLFVISIVVSWVTPDSTARFLAEDVAALEQLAGVLATLPPAVIAIIIFAKNSASLLVSFALSPILCLLPLLALIGNGVLLGWISATVMETQSLGFLLAGILPHGIIELPAFIMGEAAALSFGSLAILSLFRKEKRNIMWPHFKQNLRYLAIALALLLPAAFIEAFITPLLLRPA